MIAAFGREYAKTGKLDPKFHCWLIDAQDLRSVADYTAEAVIAEEKVDAACRWAEEFVAAGRTYLTKTEG